jgi:pimeloyl-ACP methyl ester carboxylesterase
MGSTPSASSSRANVARSRLCLGLKHTPEPSPGGAADAADGTPAGCSDPGTAFPVVLVHGFTDSPAAFDQLAAELRSHPVDFHPVPFDYGDHVTRWVTDDAIAPRLRQLLVCLADAILEAGGAGRVAVVGRSMGGLATRQALSLSADGSGQLTDEVALVAALGTPNTGSLLAGPAVGSRLEVFRFAFEQASRGLIRVPRVDNEAGRALAVGSSQLAELPPFPDTTAVFASAGEFVATSRMLFYTREDRFGDLVVAGGSATEQQRERDCLGGTDVVRCETFVGLQTDAGCPPAEEISDAKSGP